MPGPLVNLFETYTGVNEQNFMEDYHDAHVSRDASSLFQWSIG